jgi:hypothetical protein
MKGRLTGGDFSRNVFLPVTAFSERLKKDMITNPDN